jgi:predicted naringenin-chalcone synthase
VNGKKPTYVNSFVTVPGAHTVSQNFVRDTLCERLSKFPNHEETIVKAKAIFAGSAIDSRHLEIPLTDLHERRMSSTHHSILNEASLSLGERTLTAVLGSNTTAEEIDALIVVCSNFDGFPGPSRRLSEKLGFRADALFYDLSGLACGGANHGIHLAHLLLETGRCTKVVVLALDLLGCYNLMRKHDSLPNGSEIVALTIPSDGAAALLFSKQPTDSHILSFTDLDFRVHAWPDSATCAYTQTSEAGEPVGVIGKEIRTRLLDETKPLLDGDLTTPIFIHPGGRALLDELADAYPELSSSIDRSRAVLRDNGNLTSPTVLFVLADALRHGVQIEPAFRLFALGPGIFTTALRFEGVEQRRPATNESTDPALARQVQTSAHTSAMPTIVTRQQPMACTTAGQRVPRV